MKKILLAGGLMLGLSGCLTVSMVTGASVSPNQVYVTGNAFVAAEASATQYLSLPTCPVKTGLCKTAAGVKAVVVAVRSARKAVSDMVAYVAANPGQVVPVSLYNTAVSAVDGMQTAVTQYSAMKN